MSRWEDFIASHGVGDIVDGRVTRVLPFGLLIEVAPGVPGLLVDDARSEGVGSDISVCIHEVDSVKRRLSFQSA